ncbi:MAG: flagellar hook-associated protein FlgK [Gemmatimonadaceae bacterium]|nr:flagellar hook-associated protein FlgK [Gemmatimonadaceae bacterium]
MPTFGGLLSIARSGLMASQAQISTASQNVTNAQTPGYSRQRVTLTQGYPEQLPYGTFGTGVMVKDVVRMRDEMLDGSYRRDAGAAAFSEERRDALQAVEGVLGEPSNAGLANSLEQLWASWSDLAVNPDSAAARGVVRQRGAQVATQLNTFGNQIEDARTTARTQVLQTADRVNQLSSQVAEINARIVSAEASGVQAPDMRDQRDAKIDELASLIGATAYPQADGSVNINVGGDSIVDGADYKIVRVQALKSDPTRLGVALGPLPPSGTPTETMYQIGGKMAGILDSYNNIYPDAQRNLDTIAASLVAETNARHRTGFIGNAAAGDFFDAARLTARTIALDSTIAANVNNVAASGIAGESGDNGVALALSRLRDTPVTINGQLASISEGYRNVVAGIATRVNGANGAATAARTLVSQTDTRRESVKGVSIDEEMVNLMKYQQSYAAAARLISVVDEMSQVLINLGR